MPHQTEDQAANGGPAFPAIEVTEYPSGPRTEYHNGMTLRDYFAGQALAGISAHVIGPKERGGESAAQAHARWSYQVADAMLAARGQK